MQKGRTLKMTPSAVAELGRQAAFAGSPGMMHIDLVEDSCGEGWLHVRLQPGELQGVPIARKDGITLFAPEHQISLLAGLILNYFGDLNGGGFLISCPDTAESCSCGSGFRPLIQD